MGPGAGGRRAGDANGPGSGRGSGGEPQGHRGRGGAAGETQGHRGRAGAVGETQGPLGRAGVGRGTPRAPGAGGGRAGNLKGTGWFRFGTARARIFNRVGSDFESPAHPGIPSPHIVWPGGFVNLVLFTVAEENSENVRLKATARAGVIMGQNTLAGQKKQAPPPPNSKGTKP